MGIMSRQQLIRSFMLRFSVVAFALHATARSFNHTIDDQPGDSDTLPQPIYKPPGLWTQGANCRGCAAKLDSNEVMDGTWHDSTYHPGSAPHPPSIEVTFTGTAVYVYNILANNFTGVDTLTNLTFYLNGEFSRGFVHPPEPNHDYKYNVLVYQNEGLENREHHLLISAAPESISLILFDYIVYTSTEVEQTSPQPSPLPLSSPRPSTSQATSRLAQAMTPPASSREPSTNTYSPYTLSTPHTTKSEQIQYGSSTSSNESPSATSADALRNASHTGVIVGGTVGGALLIAVLLVLLTFILRRGKRERQDLYHDMVEHPPSGNVFVGTAHRLGGGRRQRTLEPFAEQAESDAARSESDRSGYIHDRHGVPRSSAALRIQVAALRKEVERLRGEREAG